MVLTYLFNPFQRRLVFLRSTGMKMELYKLKNCLNSSCSQCWDLIQLSYTNTRHFSIIQSLLGIEWDEIQFSFMLHMANFWDKSGLEVENDTNTKNSRAISHFSSSSTFYILVDSALHVCAEDVCRKHPFVGSTAIAMIRVDVNILYPLLFAAVCKRNQKWNDQSLCESQQSDSIIIRSCSHWIFIETLSVSLCSDDRLSLAEFTLICRALFRNNKGHIYLIPQSQLEEMFAVFDKNQDGEFMF